MDIKAPKGTKDLFGKEAAIWRRLEDTLHQICAVYGVEEMRTPIFEFTELFQRGVGETTDIVQKEMYTFVDKADRSITLRPEGTAGVVRAYVEHGLFNDAKPSKYYYLSPTFRYENTQAGRQRQFHQFGVEMFGSYSPAQDAEAISLAYALLESLGVKNVVLKINSLGCQKCRSAYNQVLKEYIGQNINSLCADCRERFEKNPLRILDCKQAVCQNILSGAPSVLDCLDEECSEHFAQLQRMLQQMEIPFEVDASIVRGLDYYTRTVFEFVTKEIGSQGTVCGGGRYDSLVEECGGPATGAVGFGLGMERLYLVLLNQGGLPEGEPPVDLYIGAMGESGMEKAQALAFALRKVGICVLCETLGRSVKAQMKYANKKNAKFSFIIGEGELETGTVKVKNMATGEETPCVIATIQEEMLSLLNQQNEQ